MLRFDPFGKPLDKLVAADLARLRSTAEGWYVEYKEEMPNAAGIAKSVSAFANHYGGWLFCGVAQARDGSNTAGTFPGISAAELDVATKRIKDAVAVSINPPPYYEVQALAGPCAEIGLEAERWVVVILVPPGGDSPYVHSSGRIYRRIADASDPRPETDRGVLDLLWERGRRKRSALSERLSARPALSKAESEQPYLRLVIMSDALGDRGQRATLGFDEFASVMSAAMPAADSTHLYAGAVFNRHHASTAGYVARMTGIFGSSPWAITYEYQFDGTSVVTLPIPTGLSEAHRHGTEFRHLCIQQERYNFVDVSMLFLWLGICVSKHWRLSEAGGIHTPCVAKCLLVNVWRRVPFLDTAAFLKFVREHGAPVVQEREAFAPPGTEPASLVDVSPVPASTPDAPPVDLVATFRLFVAVVQALGVPETVVLASGGELFEAASRVTTAATNRA